MQIDEVNSLFVEARDLIEDARDEAETVYFNEAHSDAKEAVNDCMGKWVSVYIVSNLRSLDAQARLITLRCPLSWSKAF